MLKFTILCFLIIGMTFEKNFDHEVGSGRDFLEGLLVAIKGKDYRLSDQCLGREFSSDVEKLLDSIEKENVLLTGVLAGKIYTDFTEKCPSADLKKLMKDSQAFLNDQEMMNKLVQHSADIVHELREVIDVHPEKASSYGEAFGKLLQTVLYSNDHQNGKVLNFLQEEEAVSFSEESIEEFVNGFFEGVSSVPYEQNKCVQDVTTVKKDIVLAFSDLITAIRMRKDIVKAFLEFYSLTLQLKGLNANCHFTILSEDIVALSTKIGMAKVAMRVSIHMISFLEYMKGTFTNFEVKEFRKSGLNFGELTKLTLNYSTI